MDWDWVEAFPVENPITWAQVKEWANNLLPDAQVGLARHPRGCPIANAVRSIYNPPADMGISIGMHFNSDATLDCYVLRLWPGNGAITPIAISDMKVQKCIEDIDAQYFGTPILASFIQEME